MVEFATILFESRALGIEHRWIGGHDSKPLVVFLHEGLGSVAMWKDYPDQLCAAAGTRGLVYSRPGYGRSTRRPPGERWRPDFMHRQAFHVLPALLEALGVREPPFLFGHSDGGSIALLYAARFRAAGVIAVAPHIVVEEFGLASIREARTAYLEADLKAGLAKYHDDPDSAFWGWNDAWLDPAFASWSIEREIGTIACPLLAVQGVNDAYGTLEQVRGIARRVAQTRLLVLPECGHSPHREQPEALTREAAAFIHRRKETDA